MTVDRAGTARGWEGNVHRNGWRRTVTVIALAAGLSPGCAVVGLVHPTPRAPTERARALGPSRGKALVYVVRPSGDGGSIRMPVTCDGAALGTTRGKRFLCAMLEPGVHLFASRAERSEPAELPIVLEAGKTYYFEQTLGQGFFGPGARLRRVDDSRGRAGLLKCSLTTELAVPATR
jgi:hypothetical protein